MNVTRDEAAQAERSGRNSVVRFAANQISPQSMNIGERSA